MIGLIVLMGLGGLAMALLAASAGRSTTAPLVEPLTDSPAIAESFEKGQLARDVRLGASGSVELYDRSLIEDDGPGGTPWGPNWDVPRGTVQGPRMARKLLHVDRPRCRRAHATMLVWPEPGESQPLEIAVNGRVRRTIAVGQAWQGWEPADLPPEALRAGDNEVVLSCRGEKGWGVGVAPRKAILQNDPSRKDRPARSFYSADGGKTWKAGYGPGQADDGEFMVRMALEQFAPEGELIGPVIDLAAPAAVAPALAVERAAVRAECDRPPRTAVELSLRSGASPVVDEEHWGGWRAVGADGAVAGPLDRFVQWRAVLRTRDPAASPILKAVSVEAQVEPHSPDWLAGLAVASLHNEDIRYTSIPFEYERFDEPALRELRQQYKLDEVVAGAATELQKMIKLRNWVHQQWKYDPPTPPYPAWDAREILRRRQGFCVQFAITYMQCALSLGIQTRFVFGMFPNARLKGQQVCGHEVTEYWSNELGKWVMMDPQRDEMFLDARTGIPTNMLQLHADQLAVYGPDGPLSFEPLEIEAKRPSPGLRGWFGQEPAPRDEPPKLDIKWGCVHWMPRNNLYAHRWPEPITQGRSEWSWTGYWHWEDGRTPRYGHWSNYSARTSDIDWTINQVRWAATALDSPGAVQLRLGTVTPDFDTFLVRQDSGDWRPSGPTLRWTLRGGGNRLEMRIRNRAGVLGRVSHLELNYTP